MSAANGRTPKLGELPFRPRDVVWFHFKGKDRYAVVLHVDGANRRAIIIHGTSVEREYECVRVEHQTRAGRALMLKCTTYFYTSNVAGAGFDELKSRGRRCPPELFLQLREFAGV